MKIDNGQLLPLQIAGVFNGMAGVSGPHLSFVPNLPGNPEKALAGILNGVPVKIRPAKDESGPFWSSRYEVL